MRVGNTRQWALIRYISGMLKKKVEALDEVTTMQLACSRPSLSHRRQQSGQANRGCISSVSLPNP